MLYFVHSPTTQNNRGDRKKEQEKIMLFLCAYFCLVSKKGVLFMKIIKRNGSEVKFDIKKIVSAIERANDTVEGNDKITEEEIYEIAGSVCKKIKNIKRALNVEEIQDIVENELMDRKFFNLARKYVTYRYQRALVRKANTTDAQIL